MHQILKQPFRFEKKYLIRIDDALRVIDHLGQLLTPDSFCNEQVNSVYFDDQDMSAYYQKVDGAYQKSKVRLRWYGQEITTNTKLYVEIKSKVGSLNYKDRVTIDIDTANKLLTQNCFISSLADTAYKNLGVMLHTCCLKPVVKVAYTRKAYIPVGLNNIRITLDTRLLGGDPRLTSPLVYRLLDADLGILEVKTRGMMDSYLQSVLDQSVLRCVSFSKYKQAVDSVLRYKL